MEGSVGLILLFSIALASGALRIPSAYKSELPPSSIPSGVRRIRAATNTSVAPEIHAGWVVAVIDTGMLNMNVY